jgi:hypothetical protein
VRQLSHQRTSREARWHGNPTTRPPTDAERAVQEARVRGPQRLLALLLSLTLLTYLYAPQWVIGKLLATPPPLHGWVLRTLPVIVRAYPWLQLAALLILSALLFHLCIAACLAAVQWRNRTAVQFRTLALDVAAAPTITPLHGVDLFIGLQRLSSTHGRARGREEALVFALIGGDDGRMRMRLRGPLRQAQGGAAHDHDWSTFLRQQIEGRAPGTTARPATDDLATALAQASNGQALAWADLVLLRDASYPLNDLGQFATDPMGPLAAALQGGPAVHYVAYEIILRAVEDRWRHSMRMAVAQIQASLTPDDLASHDALLRKAEQVAYDVIVRCIVLADDGQAARAQLRDMQEALAQFDRTTRGATQRFHVARVDRLIPGGALGRVVRISSPSTPRPISGTRDLLIALTLAVLGCVLGVLLGSGTLLNSWPALATLLEHRPQLLPLPAALPRPPFLSPGPPIPLPDVPTVARVIGAGTLGALCGLLLALAQCPARRTWRDRQAIAAIAAHAHRFAWPGPTWTIPLPGKRRSVMGPFDLAALWHVPGATLDTLVTYRSVRYLPKPAAVFLPPDDARAAERRVVLPAPKHPLDLARRRIALALADRPDGTLSLIGPTVRDLRKGSECLGPMGSGKSCFIETLAVELARVGSGFGLIDAKGDLADRLLAALPVDIHDRVIVIDLDAGIVPCINPMDARLLREGVPLATLAGQVEHLFARIDPETWPTSMGMQQFARFGLYALLEGEAAPSLLLLDLLYSSTPYREAVLRNVRSPQVLNFWRSEYPAMDLTLRRSIESFRRRLQRFITAPIVQQLFCQPQSTIYLPDLMDQRAILIIKLVPEALSEELARIIATTLLASLAAATFARQRRESDPELRWDWPLIVDEIQKFIDVEHPGDAETFFTQTRALGVGLHGAHQGLWQLGEAVQATVIQSLGGLVVLGPVKQDAMTLVKAYAETGISEADFAAVRAREELLIRFPIHDQDSGLLSGIPRARPPATLPTPALRAHLLVAAQTAPFRALRAPAADAQAAADDALLERLWQAAAHRGPADTAALIDTLASHHDPGAISALIERLRLRSAAHHAHQANALVRDGRQLPDAALIVRENSLLRYGVDPLITACYARALALQYPADQPHAQNQVKGRGARLGNVTPSPTADSAVSETNGAAASTVTANASTGSTSSTPSPRVSPLSWDGTAPTPHA